MNTDEKLQKIGEQVIEVICGIVTPKYQLIFTIWG